jgi:hypothetical protein
MRQGGCSHSIRAPAAPGGRRPRRACVAATAGGGEDGGPAPPPRGAALGPQHAAAIAQRWAPLLPDEPQERNRLLSRRMKALTYPGAAEEGDSSERWAECIGCACDARGRSLTPPLPAADPYAYDIFKQDGKEYM